MSKQRPVRFTFGKYRDKLVSEVALDDPGYLRWLLENVDIRDEALREAVEAYVDEDVSAGPGDGWERYGSGWRKK